MHAALAQKPNTAKVTVTGIVKDDLGATIKGVSVKVKGGPAGVVTDDHGLFTIKVSPEGTLVFSAVGFKNQELKVNNRSLINVTMITSTNELEDVVVVGYGTQKQKEITNSIVKVKGEDIQNIPVASPEALLQGRAAGVQVTQNGGQPGGGVTVRIRGNTSINAGNNPLYVVDGVPINSENLSTDNRGNEINPLADINASDIESMEILKDASAAAIYGSRAANGVILITTKRGKVGAPSYSVNIYRGWQKISRVLPSMTQGQYIEFQQETRVNSGLPAYSFPTLLNDSVNTNWLDHVLQTAPMLNVDASVRGGSANLRYSLSGNLYEQEGIVKATKFRRMSMRMNLDYNADKNFTIGNSLTLSRTNNDRAVGDDQGNSLIGVSLRKAPTIPIYNADGSYYLLDPNYGSNPVAYINEQKYTTQSTRIAGNVYAEYKFSNNLKFRSMWGVDLNLVEDDYFRPSTVELNGNTLGAAGTITSNTWLHEQTLTYTKKIKSNHNITLLGGFSQQETDRRYTRSTVTNYSSNIIPTINGGSIISSAISDKQQNGIESYFARANYSYMSKYLLQLSGRYDGSSRFGADNKFAFFPSASAGWRIIEERFMSNVSFLDELKLRASAGVNGNQNGIGNYSSQGIFATGSNYAGIGGIAQTGLANSDLRWEKTTAYDLGLDIGFLKNKINITADVYLKKTSDLLLNVQLPTSSGYSNVLMNVGNTENKGWEFAITTKNITKKNFSWTTSFNISGNRNKIVSLANDEKEILFTRTSLAPPAYLRVGDAIGTFYGWDFLGVLAYDTDNKTGLTNNGTYVYGGGDAYYTDVNGDNKIDEQDITKIGDANPDFYGGLNNTFKFKGIDLNIFMNYSYGGDIYNLTVQHDRDNIRMLNRWRKDGDVTDIPRISSTDQSKVSRRFLEDGSFIRLKNVTVGYNFSKNLLKRYRIKNARLYFTAQNLVTLTEYSGFDPEVNSVNPSVINMGLDYFAYPHTRTYLVGLSIGF